ncbi:MAG: hypothetical protein EAX81_03110 [Candidatus Thorarchaeota archaeon]|nr:hypothetical protein [Candidatus Thorarchaeota archaeon]
MNLLISTGLLPIGGWSFLDELYQDPLIDVICLGNDQYAKLFDSHFQIVDVYGGVEIEYWVQAIVSLENGCLIEGYFTYGKYGSHFITDIYSWYDIEIELALLSQVVR